MEITEEPGTGVRALRVGPRARGTDDWIRLCVDLARGLRPGLRPPTRVVLDLDGRPGEPLDRPPQALVEAAAELAAVRRRVGALVLASATGTLEGPLLALALSADLLAVETGMEGRSLIWQDHPLPVPGELPGLAGRLGRARALEHAFLGEPVRAAELTTHRGGACEGTDAAAWRAALAGSRWAQAAASATAGAGRGRGAAEALERVAFAGCFARPDLSEGTAAFFERRRPDFPSNRPPRAEDSA